MAIPVIVVGLGSRGRDWVREVRGHRAFDVAAAVERDPAARQRVAADIGVESDHCFADLPAALAQVPGGAVIVATPVETHATVCRMALEAERGVLVEKPFALNLADAIDVVSLAERRGVPLLVAQNYRYMRAFRTARRLVEDGTLGDVSTVVCQYYRVPHTMAPSLAVIADRALWGMGIHHLDALRHVLGRPVTSVTAETYSAPWGTPPIGASLRAMLTFEGGARGFYTATYESSGHEYFEGGQEYFARFVGERATLHMLHRWLVLCERGRWPKPVRRGARAHSEEQVVLHEWDRAITQGVASTLSGRDNLQTMAVAEACVRSAAERRWIDPQELLDGCP